MKFTPTPLDGAWIIDIEPIADERGFFARSWCRQEFQRHGLNQDFVQCNISFNERKGTLRGLHYQEPPYSETKIVRCTAGAIYDLIVDIREASRSYLQWFAVELSAANRRMLYVPDGFAHGFQVLLEQTEVFYQMSEQYHPESARGIRWDDVRFAFRWPVPDPILSPRDRSYPDFLP